MYRPEDSLILIADDDELLCSAVSRYLLKSGYKVAIANNGHDALEMCFQMSPQLIIADLRMPVMDGIEFLEKAKKENCSAPIIITTGHPDVETAIKAIQHGAFDYIIKPYQLELLQQKVAQAIQSTKLVRENIVLNELVSLHDITSKLTSTHDKEELLDITFKYCLEISKADSGSLQLYDRESKELAIVREKGINSEKKSSLLVNSIEWPISKWVFTHSQALLISKDVTYPETQIPLNREDVQSAISVPLKVSDEVIGVVNLNRTNNNDPFSMVDLNVVDVLASQAGIAINNANLYSSINQKLDELSLISNYSEQLMGLVDKYDVIKCLFETVRKHFPIDFIGFLVVQRRYHEFLYWSRGTISQEPVKIISQQVVDDYNKVQDGAVQSRRVTVRPLVLPQVSNSELQLPFGFQKIISVCWEDFKFGAIYFGASKDLPNPAEKVALLSSLVSQTRIALTNSKLYNDMKENYIRTIKALAIAVDAKDTYTHGHSENVMNIAEELAKEMNIDEKTVGIIRDAGLLHDIGKIGIPGYILNKPGPLTYEEFNGIMKTHSTLGANIVKDVPFLQDLYKLILYHHEHFDGAGYPEGIKGEHIPLGARILHLSDAFEAMTSNRPYRNSLGKKEAIKRLIEGSAKQFDPAVVDAFLRIAQRKGWLDEESHNTTNVVPATV